MLDFNTMTAVNDIPTISKAGREARSPYIPGLKMMADKAIADKTNVGITISANDDGWVFDKDGKTKLRHKAYTAATAWGRKAGITFSFRNMPDGSAKLFVNADKSEKVQEAIAAGGKQKA